HAENNELLDELLSQDMYYRFAEKYTYEHPEVINFMMNDVVTEEFYNFLNSQSFEYTSRAESKTAELQKLITEKNYSDKARSLVSELEIELKTERFRDFERSKPVIKHMLEAEIMRKMNKPEKEVMAAGFNEDSVLQAAIS